jgi:hypothetical protein
MDEQVIDAVRDSVQQKDCEQDREPETFAACFDGSASSDVSCGFHPESYVL